MYKGKSILVIAPAYNEEPKIGNVVNGISRTYVDKVLVIDDGSIDNTANVAREAGAQVMSLGRLCGVGYAIREGLGLAQREGFDIVVVIAGNNKDNASEIPRLLDPICDQNMDFVIGSRFMTGGIYGGDMPFYRKYATRIHPFLVSLVTGRSITESTNGFRSMKVSVLDDSRINLSQRWLNDYELEVYLLIKLIKLGYKIAEVPCTKIYPSKEIGNTKMRPFVDWWKMIRPIFRAGL